MGWDEFRIGWGTGRGEAMEDGRWVVGWFGIEVGRLCEIFR